MDWKRTLASAVVVGALSLTAVAQSTSSATTTTGNTKTPVVRHRQRNQQHRIAQGARSGQLTAGETRHLERQQAHIQAQKKADKADGTVTPQERAQLHREQNRASRTIYRDKHNNRTQSN